jgi:predicted deacylase
MGMWPKTEEVRPPFQVIVKASEWVRAQKGGILDLLVKPGDLIYEDDPIGAILNPFGKTVTQIRAPTTGIVIGVTTAPLTIPGTGIIHIARLKKTLSLVERSLRKTKKKISRKK